MKFTCCQNLLQASPKLELYRLSNWSFCRLWILENWWSFCWFSALGKSELHYWLFILFWAGHSSYTEFGQDFRLRKTMQKKNSGNTNRIWHTSFSMIQSAIIKGIGPPGNKKTSKVQSFSFCNTFFWFVW